MPKFNEYLSFVRGLYGLPDPTPPASSAAIAKPEKVVDLSAAFQRAYSVPRRIA